MKHLFLDISIFLNILGLSVLSLFETLRPGSVSIAVNFGVLWLIALALSITTLYLRRLMPEKATT